MARQIRVTYRTFGLPEPEPGSEPPQGGEWWIFSGMGTGLDGTIYCGLCDHRFVFEGARLIAYYPQSDTMRTLADMNQVCGHDGRTDLCGQTKIHTRIMPDREGRMYLGLHSCERDYAPPELMARLTAGYPGGHWIRYDPRTDATEDLGIPVPGESLMGFTLDPVRQRLYATTHTNSLLVAYDIAAGCSEVLGSIGKFPTRVMECTADGMVYTFDDEGRVVRYDPDARELRTLDARLPGWESGANLVTSFATVLAPDGYTIYGIAASFYCEPREPLGVLLEGRRSDRLASYAFAYDTREGADGCMRNIGRVRPAAESEGEGDLHLHHSIALTREGDVLFVSARRDCPAHLMMIDVSAGPGRETLRDLGEMWGEGEEGYVETALAGTTGLDGTVYFGGLRKSEKHPRDYTRWVLIILPEGCWGRGDR